MRIAHLADLHLGYRAYNRITSQGINRREADVFTAFKAALNKIAEIQPDLVIIAGDLFHTVRPSNLTIQHTFRALYEMREKQGVEAPIIIIGGNHDSPRSVDSGCILDLFANIPGIYVVHHAYQGIKLNDLDTSVFCLCHRAMPEFSELKLEPDAGSATNILTFHGTVEGVAKGFTEASMINRSDIIRDCWNYIAAGHYHINTPLADNAYYSGSIEYTSTNVWEESYKPKGFIEYDTDKQTAIFHTVPTRDVVDLNALDANGLTVQHINEAIEARISGIDGGHQDKIIRLVIENLPRHVQQDLDYSLIRKLKTEALHLEVQFRRMQWDASDGREEHRGQTRPLEDEWTDFLKDGEPLPGGVDRDKLTELGLQYLGQQETTAE